MWKISKTARLARWGAVAVVAALLVAAPVVADSAPSGMKLAASAVEAMGGAAAVAELSMIAVRADCSGPGGAYVSEVVWRRDGSTVMRQSAEDWQSTILAKGDEAWSVDDDGETGEALAPAMAAMVHGHAFHATLFELDRRFHDQRAAGTGEGGCLLVEMLDTGNRPASVCLDPATKLPARFSFTPAGGGLIAMELSGYRRFGDLLYFTAFVLRQGDERYDWVYTSIEPTASAPGDTNSPAAAAAPAGWKPGERISLSLKDADLAEVLRSFARLAGFNLVLHPSVRGKVTVELQDVAWERALEVILKTHGLGVEDDGATWRVGSR